MKRKFNIEGIENKRPNLFDPSVIDERKYLLFPNDNAVTATLYQNTLYEDYIYKFLIQNEIQVEGTNIIDVGANNGQITVELAHLVGDMGKVISFEPQRIIFQQLCANVFVNGLDNVYAFNLAIGNENGLITIEKPNYFNEGPVNFGNVHVGVQDNYDFIEIKSLDTFDLDNVSVLKIDVQGYEKQVLLGAKETILKNKPIIFLEVESDQLELYGENDNSVFEIILSYDYVFARLNDGMSYQTNSGLCLDFVAIPKDRVNEREWKTIFEY